MACSHCNEYTRAHLRRARRSPRPARACRRSSRACRSRPAPGSRGAPSCCARAPPCSPSTGRPGSASGSSQAGIAAGGQGGSDPVLVSVFLDGGIDSLSVLAPVNDPRLPEPAPEPGAGAGRRARRSPRTRACAGTRRAAPLDALHREGKVTVFPAIGYAEPRPVALHLAPLLGGRRARPERADRLDRPPARRDRHRRQPAAGPLARRLRSRRRWPPRQVPVAAIDGPSYDLWAPGVWGERRAADVRRRRRARPRGRGRQADVGLSGRRHGSRRRRCSCSASSSRSPATRSPPRSPIPTTRTLVRREPRRARGDARRRAADPLRRDRAPGGYDTHDNQADELRPRPQADGRHARRLPGRPRGARPRRPRHHAGLVGVRPPAGGERLAAPTTAPAARAFVIGSRSAARWSASSRASPSSTTTTTCARPPTSARSTARSARAVVRRRRGRGHPRRGRLRPPALIG